MIPEWLLAVPVDLAASYYVLPRPEGKRALVVACNGKTVSRLRNGRRLHHFPSALPGGSRANAGQGRGCNPPPSAVRRCQYGRSAPAGAAPND
jgi:snurportin-1